MGKNPILSRILGIRPNLLNKVMHESFSIYRKTGELKVSNDDEKELLAEGWECLGYGPAGVLALLKSLPPDRIPPVFGEWGYLLISHALHVIPSKLRPMVFLRSGGIATSDLNDHYRNIISRNNGLERLRQLEVRKAVVKNAERLLQQEVEAFQMGTARTIGNRSSERLKSIFCIMSAMVLDQPTKSVDWSGQARAVVDDRWHLELLAVRK